MSKKKIFLVDDSAMIRKHLKKFLEVESYEVNEAENGLDAIEKLNSGYCPDVCLFDVEMPQMDGRQLLEKFRSIEKYKKIPVIILTSLKDPENIVDLFRKGANDYLTKPCHKDELLVRIKNFVNVKNLQDKLFYTMKIIQEKDERIRELEAKLGIDSL